MYFNFIPLLIILISKKVIKYISYFFKKSVSKISQINMACKWLTIFYQIWIIMQQVIMWSFSCLKNGPSEAWSLFSASLFMVECNVPGQAPYVPWLLLSSAVVWRASSVFFEESWPVWIYGFCVLLPRKVLEGIYFDQSVRTYLFLFFFSFKAIIFWSCSILWINAGMSS